MIVYCLLFIIDFVTSCSNITYYNIIYSNMFEHVRTFQSKQNSYVPNLYLKKMISKRIKSYYYFFKQLFEFFRCKLRIRIMSFASFFIVTEPVPLVFVVSRRQKVILSTCDTLFYSLFTYVYRIFRNRIYLNIYERSLYFLFFLIDVSDVTDLRKLFGWTFNTSKPLLNLSKKMEYFFIPNNITILNRRNLSKMFSKVSKFFFPLNN